MTTPLERAYTAIQNAEEVLASLVEEERKQNVGKQCMYTFVYEQVYEDGQYHPAELNIMAHTIGEAFAILGKQLDTYDLQVRNVRYGLYDAMQDESEQVSIYWTNKRKEQQAHE